MLSKEEKKIKGEVVLMKSNVLDFNDFHASFLDRLHEFLGQRVSLQLVIAVHGDHSKFSLSSFINIISLFLSLSVSVLDRFFKGRPNNVNDGFYTV